MYQMCFVMLAGETVLRKWTCMERFNSKEDAMHFAQNTAKAFNGCDVKVYYYIVIC